MKKVRFKRSGYKGMYIALCVGILAVGAASVVGYRAVVGSLTKNLVPDQGENQQSDNPSLDYSQVDSVLSGIDKQDEQPAQVESDDQSKQDITDELQTLYYEQAKMFPVSGDILTEYSWGELVKTSGGVWRTHDGIDIAAESGDSVKAMTSGTVSDIYSDPLWGNCVVIDHGDTVVGYYCGLAPDIKVAVGDSVSAGAAIGIVGNTADIESDMDSHLHFALKYEGVWIDPVSYIEPMK